MNTQKLSRLFANYDRLVKIAKQLHHQDENSCNYGLTPRQEKTVERLEKEITFNDLPDNVRDHVLERTIK